MKIILRRKGLKQQLHPLRLPCRPSFLLQSPLPSRGAVWKAWPAKEWGKVSLEGQMQGWCSLPGHGIGTVHSWCSGGRAGQLFSVGPGHCLRSSWSLLPGPRMGTVWPWNRTLRVFFPCLRCLTPESIVAAWTLALQGSLPICPLVSEPVVACLTTSDPTPP